MSNTNPTPGEMPAHGAGSSLGAHSKDAQPVGGKATDPAEESVVDRGRKAAEKAAETVSAFAHDARDAVGAQGTRAAEHARNMVQESPGICMAVFGMVCFSFGLLLGTRR